MATEDRKTLLVPTDFSETTRKAVEYAAMAAEKRGFSLHILHVINKETRSSLKKEYKGLETILERLNELKSELLNTYDIDIHIMAREGSIFNVINEVAEEIKPRWMALGTHGKKGLQYLFGSYALKIVTQTKCPVLVLQGDSPIKFPEQILFPINIYTAPRQQLPAAVGAAKFFDSKIHVYKQKFNDPGEESRLSVISDQIEKYLEDNEISYTVDQAEKQSQFVNQLLDYATENNIDSLLMMTNTSIDSPDFNHTHWSESLIYNDKAIPVFCINPVYLGQIHFRL